MVSINNEEVALRRSGNGPVVLYELNEVPWQVFDWYCKLRPRSHIAILLRESACFTTRTHDDGELHPWSTWPTLHRGVYNSRHNIRFINQDLSCAEEYPPIWETLAESGYRVGVFGSLQSYPVPPAPAYEFYVPDTFASGSETKPDRYRCFQSVNLRQTKADGATAKAVEINADVWRDLIRLPRAGVTLRTIARLGIQLLKEKINSAHRSRRSLLQAPMAFDVFLHAFRSHKPDFSTFFTNHVAGAMHRYWKHAFPEDFGTEVSNADDAFKRNTLIAAMDGADEQVGTLRNCLAKNGGVLFLATSMGQEAVERGRYFGEIRLVAPALMMNSIGFTRPWRDLLAMQPDFNFAFDSTEDADVFMRMVHRLKSVGGESVWRRVRQEGATVNLGLAMLEDVIVSGELLIEAEAGVGGRVVKLREVGLEPLTRDPGTGYHQPLGCLICWGPGIVANISRKEIPLAEVRGMILAQFAHEFAPAATRA